MMMNLNTNMNNNLTQMSSLVLVCLLGNGHGPSCTKFYLVIPGTEYSQTHLFLISGNDTKFCYDLIKFYSSQEQDRFTGQLELGHFKFYCNAKDNYICSITSVPYYST